MKQEMKKKSSQMKIIMNSKDHEVDDSKEGFELSPVLQLITRLTKPKPNPRPTA